MTPCDGTDNSTTWCCGATADCCGTDFGGVKLAPTFLGTLASTTSVSTSTTSFSTSKTTPPIDSDTSPALPGGAIAGIVIGALAGVALIGATLFFVVRRRRSAEISPPLYVEADSTSEESKTFYAHEADGIGAQVSEAPAINERGPDRRMRVHEMS